jgi:predicted ATP-grasp superfamily ATP-dependent carboligase
MTAGGAGGGDTHQHLLIFGASVRAAAFSALRAGLRPWCADLFADTDLQARCPALALSAADYPDGLIEVCAGAPDGPWMYTGGLENRPGLVEALCRLRPLWGNGAEVLRRIRSPLLVAECLRRAGLACPEVRLHADEVPRRGRWLVKPLDGTGGRGIAFHTAGRVPEGGGKVYFQEHVEGEPCSAVYLGVNGGASFLEATRQLVGEPWLHAAPFHYCGSVGPLPLSRILWRKFERLGIVLARSFRLRGLFGVDCVRRDGIPWAVEVNPRYPASVEVLEDPDGPSAVALHRAACERAEGPLHWQASPHTYENRDVRGKAVLFARDTAVFPADAVWTAPVRQFPSPPMPLRFADIPPAGQRIERGRPVLTFFTAGASQEECLERLRQIAADLDRWLFDR